MKGENPGPPHMVLGDQEIKEFGPAGIDLSLAIYAQTYLALIFCCEFVM